MIYPNIDPVAFSLGPVLGWGPLAIRWYGVLHVVGFSLALFWALWRGKRVHPPFAPEKIIDLFFYVTLGTILGGTMGYILFYHPQKLLENPFALFRFWEPGRSFHGGLLGVVIAVVWYCYREKTTFLRIGDLIAPIVPAGLALGRIGNFLNAELWGRTTTLPWGMVFPEAGPVTRHPSQLYEFFLEGVLMLIILNIYARKERRQGAITGLFLILYGAFRFIVEYFREPDYHLGWINQDWITMGQLLSLPMIAVGLYLMYGLKPRSATCTNT